MNLPRDLKNIINYNNLYKELYPSPTDSTLPGSKHQSFLPVDSLN